MSTRAGRVSGAGELDALFPDEALLTPVPWAQAGKRRTHATYDQEVVGALLAIPPLAAVFADLDPTDLHATQPSLTRAGVAYYLHDDYRRHGRTYADQFKAGNKFPIVYRRGAQNLILSGHHRAAAALLLDKPYRARVIEGGWGAQYGRDVDVVTLERPQRRTPIAAGTTVALTPSLLIGAGDECLLPHTIVHHARTALDVICRAGNTAWMPYDTDHEQVRDAMTRLSPDPAWAAHQLHFAATGRILFPD